MGKPRQNSKEMFGTFLYFSADGKYEAHYQPNVVIGREDNSTYNIYQIPCSIYKSSCEIDVKYFPFDEQVCEMKFGSWTFQAAQLKFRYTKFSGLDLTDYLKSGTWDLVDCPSRIEICVDKNKNQSQALYIATFKIRRKTLFYTVNLLIPCILISFVSVSVYMLPPDSCEKITLIISILLALVVFLLLISKMLPPSPSIPLIAQYLMFDFLMNIIAIGTTVFVINRNYRTARTHRMPSWIRVVFLNYLPRILLMKRPDHEERWKTSPTDISEMTASKSSLNINSVLRSPPKAFSKPNIMGSVPSSEKGGEMIHTECMLNRKPEVAEDTEPNRLPITVSPEMLEAIEDIMFMRRHLEWEDKYETVKVQ